MPFYNAEHSLSVLWNWFFKWAIHGLFSFSSTFQNSWQLMFNLNLPTDWIQTAFLWNWKRPLYQLSHNHCPGVIKLLKGVLILLIQNIIFSQGWSSQRKGKFQFAWIQNRLCKISAKFKRQSLAIFSMKI